MNQRQPGMNKSIVTHNHQNIVLITWSVTSKHKLKALGIRWMKAIIPQPWKHLTASEGFQSRRVEKWSLDWVVWIFKRLSARSLDERMRRIVKERSGPVCHRLSSQCHKGITVCHHCHHHQRQHHYHINQPTHNANITTHRATHSTP